MARSGKEIKVPGVPVKKPAKWEGDDVRAYIEHFGRRSVELQQWRTSYWSTWREINRFILPYRGRFDGIPPTANNNSKGAQRTGEILNRHATKSHKKLAAFLLQGICSPSRDWFQLDVQDSRLRDNTEVKQWLDQVSDLIRAIFNASNFYQAMQHLFEELPGFGTGAVLVSRDFENIIQCYPMTAGEYLLALNGSNIVDTCYREFVMTIGAAKEKFGYENLSDEAQNLFDSGSLSQEIQIRHSVEPNLNIDTGAIESWRSLPYISCYHEIGRSGNCRALEMTGLHKFNVLAPRWLTVSTDVYGHGPGEDILPAVKSLQKAEMMYAEGVEKMVRPPMAAPASMMQGRINLMPNALNIVNGNETAQIRPLMDLRIDLSHLQQKISDYKEEIDQGLFADLIAIFNGAGNPQMTATEVKARQQEQMFQLGPMLESFHTECLKPMIEIVFDLLVRCKNPKILPDAPKVLQGAHVQPRFVSMLAQAQRAVNTTSIEGLVAFLGTVAAASPGVFDNVDLDEAVREYGDLLGTPAKIMRDKDDVAKIRADKAEQAAQQQGMQQSMAAVQGAQTMSQTPLGNGQNALGMMLGIPGSPGSGDGAQ